MRVIDLLVSRGRGGSAIEERKSPNSLAALVEEKKRNMLRSRHITLLLVCWGLVLWGSEAADEAGENSETTSGCYRSQLSEYETLFRNAFALKFEETGATESTVSVYINCMSFRQDKELETAIVSGNVSTAAGEQVLRFTCQEDMLFVLESEREFSKDRNESCLECAGPESTAEDACLFRESST